MKTTLFTLLISIIFINHLHSQANKNVNQNSVQKVDSLKEYGNKAKQKVDDFLTYLKTISDKKLDTLERKNALENALKLFIKDTVSVEVSNLNSKTVVNYRIREYLERFYSLPYYKIDFDWKRSELKFISRFKPGPDGLFYAVISFEQVFRGYYGDMRIYKDKTVKDITIILKPYKVDYGDEKVTFWEIKLGDIKVTETSKI